MSPHWLSRAERRGTRLSIGFLLATLVMATLLAYSASDAARSHRETAENTLRDYAGLAAWEYSRRVRTQLNRAFHTPVHQVRSLVVRANAPRPSPDVVRRAVESCDCTGSVPAANAFVRVDLDRRRVTVTGARAARKPDWLVEAIERRLAADPGIRFATATGPSVDGVGEDFGAFTILYDGAEQPLAAYGFLVPSREIGRILREDCSRDGLLPPALTGDEPTDSLVYITVAAASGRPLYQSPVPYDSTFSGRDTLGARFAGITVAAAIRPAAAGNLVIGGLPTSRLPWVLGLLLLTLGVGTAALYQFRRELELARMRDRFVSGVSHELRTPLAQIRVFGELLETGNLRTEGDRSRSVTVICREARRLTHLVENVLQFSNLRRAATHLALEETPVRTLIGETVEAFEPLARQRDARIVQRVDEPFVVTADRGVLSQMLLNLLDNAVKHGPARQTVEIGARRRGDTAEVWVRDEGPGVPPAEQERIWEPYYRGTPRRENAGSGCGIGLALVAELAALHGGRARVENGEIGARFVVELPGAAGTAPAEPPTARSVRASA